MFQRFDGITNRTGFIAICILVRLINQKPNFLDSLLGKKVEWQVLQIKKLCTIQKLVTIKL